LQVLDDHATVVTPELRACHRQLLTPDPESVSETWTVMGPPCQVPAAGEVMMLEGSTRSVQNEMNPEWVVDALLMVG
jgi:hypothetical protein